MDEFYNSISVQISCSCLGSIIQYSDLLMAILTSIPHSNRWDNWIEVSRNILLGSELISWLEINHSLLHFKTIGVSPEGLIGIEIIIHSPVHCHISSVFFSWDTVELDFKLNDIIELGRVSDLYYGEFKPLMVSNCPLLDILTLLIRHIWIDSWIFLRFKSTKGTGHE